jgi:hypothetical protein
VTTEPEPEPEPEPAPEPAPEPEPEPAPEPRGQSRWRRFTPLLLVAAAVAVGSILLPKLPREREIELKVADPASIVSVDVSWSAGDEPIHGGTWRFSPGKAPAAVISRVSLPDGRYDVDVRVSRVEGDPQSWHRSVDLEKVEHMTLRVP